MAVSEISRKVAHVRAAKQGRLHVCHWPGCEAQVPPAVWGCKPHWFALPKELRNRIWGAYRVGQEADRKVSPEYVAAARAVQAWIHAQGQAWRVCPDCGLARTLEPNGRCTLCNAGASRRRRFRP
jgi:hypothetical protein